MSTPSISYPLRPGKFIDRALFIELLQFVDRWQSIRDGVYIGFGGPCLEDHRVIHSSLGLTKLLSIERDEDVFFQQQFNRPLKRIVCVHREASDFVAEFELEMARAKFSDASKRIIWFDYEKPEEVMSQLQSLQALVDLANDGDIIRVTLNAHAASLGGARENETEQQLQERRFARMRARFGDFLSETATKVDTQTARYPSITLNAIKIAVLRATSKSGRMFLPLLLVQYSDGQPMVTVTGIVLPDADEKKFLSKTGISKWQFYARDWKNVEQLQKAPALTLHERMQMDRSIASNTRALPAKIKYLAKLHNGASKEILNRYRRYQRFFPQFVHVEI